MTFALPTTKASASSPRRTTTRARTPIDILLLHYTGMRRPRRRSPGCAIPTRKCLVALPGRRGRPRRSAGAGGAARLARGRRVVDRARPTSTRARSASRSSIPATSSATATFPDAQIEAVIALCRDILARHPIPPRARARPFRCRARRASRIRASCSLGAPRAQPASASGSSRHRSRKAGRSARRSAARASPSCRRMLARFGYGLPTHRRVRRGDAATWSRPSSATSGPRGSTASRTARPARRCAGCWRRSWRTT